MSDARTGVLELTLGDSYIGSAYSPQVEVTDTATGHEVAITYMSPSGLVTERFDVADGETGPQGPAGFSPTVTITDTPTGHTVTITDADGPHSYDVPNYAQEEQERQDAWDALSREVTDAITAAESATSAASTAASSATSAASSASTAAQAATTAAASANTAASSANAAATAANTAASTASTAADAATTAAGDATDAASAANTAAQAAQEAAKGISGAADALMGEPSESTWARRMSAGSGMARVESVQGATEVQDGELVPVRIAGIKSVGFNQWDEVWEKGYINDSDGTNNDLAPASYVRSKNLIPVLPSTDYFFASPLEHKRMAGKAYFYDANKNYLTWIGISFSNVNPALSVKTIPANAYYMRFWCNYEGSYQNDICINISNPALNGTYKPYTTDSVEWGTQTLRAAGSVRDMLYSDHVDVRVGVVDLGTLTWIVAANSNTEFRARRSDNPDVPMWVGTTGNVVSNCKCAEYESISPNAAYLGANRGIAIAGDSYIAVGDSTYTTAADFKAAMAGVLLYYPLATPATTPISPALPMSYRVEQGGTESIIVPTGEISAVPVLTVAEGESAADLVMAALACIAAPDGPVATANHAINTFLTMQGKLYKVTSAIAVGESIVAGTNVTQTTVMAELIARTA